MLTALAALVLNASVQAPAAAHQAPARSASVEESGARIAWFGRLADAHAEAARTGRPILLMSAAPQCSGAPGMW